MHIVEWTKYAKVYGDGEYAELLLLGIFDLVSVFVQDLVNVLAQLVNAAGIDKDMGVVQVFDDEVGLFVQAKDDLLDWGVTKKKWTDEKNKLWAPPFL